MIEARIDYEYAIHNNPMKLLKSIKENALNYQDLKYNIAIITDTFRVFFNCI